MRNLARKSLFLRFRLPHGQEEWHQRGKFGGDGDCDQGSERNVIQRAEQRATCKPTNAENGLEASAHNVRDEDEVRHFMHGAGGKSFGSRGPDWNDSRS